MSDFIRDTTFGQVIRYCTKRRYLQYPEERFGYQVPAEYTKAISEAQRSSHTLRDELQYLNSTSDSNESKLDQDLGDTPADNTGDGDINFEEKATSTKNQSDISQDKALPTQLPDGTILVDWYGSTDPENPQNWTSSRKAIVTFVIVLYTLAVYAGSSIITPSFGGIMSTFNVSLQATSLTLSMYVFAYGLGPMLWSPLSEIPSIGRNPPYILTFTVFVILAIPTALTTSFAGLVILRFLLGFFGSPCLATGGASIADLYSLAKLPYGLSLWAVAACSGPAIAPLVSGFSVPVKGWRWSTWELLWLSGPILVAMIVLLPETSPSTILLRRAQRLRTLTGYPHLKSQSEIDQSRIQPRELIIESLYRPLQVMLFDPSIGFTALYAALIYGIFYSFFESFPLVYGGMHGFNLGEQGLVFLSIIIGALLGVAFYWSYIRFVVEPSILAGEFGAPERRLVPALSASFLLPIGLLIFAWTARPDIHWIAPTVGIVVQMIGIFVVLQCIFLYLPLSYPQYAASLFAGNDLARSSLGAVMIHVSQPLYHDLGVDRGVTLLAGLTMGCVGGIFALWYYGDKLRARSRFAVVVKMRSDEDGCRVGEWLL